MSRNRGERTKWATRKKRGAKRSIPLSNKEQLRQAIRYHQAGRIDQARAGYLEILKKDPENIEAMHLAGAAALQGGDSQGAVYLLQKAIDRHPNPPSHYYDNLGLAYQEVGNSREAIACFQKAIRLNPKEAQAYLNIGNSYFDELQFADAADAYKKVLSLKPDFGEVYDSLGQALEKQGETAAAVSCYKRSMALSPDYPLPFFHMGIYCRSRGEFSESIGYFKKALVKSPGDPGICNDLGTLFQDQGKIEAAMGWYEKALALSPGFATAYSNLLLCKNYSADIPPVDLADDHKRWQTVHAVQSDGVAVHTNEKDPDRMLRIGYVSPDFFRHSVAFFMEPVIAAHDRRSFKVYCYATGVVSDDVTRRFRELTDEWRDIGALSDEIAADLIRRDRIDILVDLAGHTAKNRLPLFSRKPAPVQVTYLGYPNTTGLEAVDYRLTDALADPPGKTDLLYSEQLVRLKNGFLCYSPPSEAPPVEKRNDSDGARVVFGSFNHVAKITPEVVRIWSKILKAVDGARFFLKARAFTDAGAVERVQSLFRENGVADERIEYCGYIPDMPSHFNLYNQVDIALDTFPYNGTTTTCDALWMGTPVITLSGNTHASRVGTSLLSAAGLVDLITVTSDGYIEKAIELARDSRRLRELQNGLRAVMTGSRLMDANGFTRDLEAAYRNMWRTWCRAHANGVDEGNAQSERLPEGSAPGAVGIDEGAKAVQLTRDGEAFFEAGDMKAAENAFLQAIEVDPSCITAYNNLGVLFWHAGDAGKAALFITRALAIDPSDETALRNFERIRVTMTVSEKEPPPGTGERG